MILKFYRTTSEDMNRNLMKLLGKKKVICYGDGVGIFSTMTNP